MGRPKKNKASSSAYIPKKIQSLEGAFDILSDTQPLWNALTRRLNKVSRVYGFSRVETPVVEDRYLYESFYRQQPHILESLLCYEGGGKAIAIRPAILPSVLRSYYQHKVFDKSTASKWCYTGMVAKMEDGGLRTDYEFGFEIFGQFTHLSEAQVIGAVWDFLTSLGLGDLMIEINNIGSEESQEVYENTLQDFLAGKKYQLCDDCNEHLSGRILNVFRCNNLDCQALLAEAPAILDFLDQESHKHFTSVLEALDELGIPYQLNPLYAGPQGVSKTNVVLKYKYKGETKVIGEGGYHDGLIQNLCGKAYPCFGFSGSLNRMHEFLEQHKVTVEKEYKNDVFLVPLGELASKKSLRLFRDLTRQQISVHDHFGDGGVKNQLKLAETYKAPIALIIGQKEAMDERVILRDVKSGMQEIISYDKIVEEVKKRLGK